LFVCRRWSRSSVGHDAALWTHRAPGKETGSVKTMICNQLGGPCEFPHHGATADEVIKAQDRHLHEAVSAGDEAHKGALKDMKGRWKHPISGMTWYRNVKRDLRLFPKTDPDDQAEAYTAGQAYSKSGGTHQ
jgi:hypothetical protein